MYPGYTTGNNIEIVQSDKVYCLLDDENNTTERRVLGEHEPYALSLISVNKSQI